MFIDLKFLKKLGAKVKKYFKRKENYLFSFNFGDFFSKFEEFSPLQIHVFLLKTFLISESFETFIVIRNL